MIVVISYHLLVSESFSLGPKWIIGRSKLTLTHTNRDKFQYFPNKLVWN